MEPILKMKPLLEKYILFEMLLKSNQKCLNRFCPQVLTPLSMSLYLLIESLFSLYFKRKENSLNYKLNTKYENNFNKIDSNKVIDIFIQIHTNVL